MDCSLKLFSPRYQFDLETAQQVQDFAFANLLMRSIMFHLDFRNGMTASRSGHPIRPQFFCSGTWV
jgi:hypothetical protein